jgi:hypothetical protein
MVYSCESGFSPSVAVTSTNSGFDLFKRQQKFTARDLPYFSVCGTGAAQFNNKRRKRKMTIHKKFGAAILSLVVLFAAVSSASAQGFGGRMSKKEKAGWIGGGAVAGAVIGGLIGGKKGAVIGGLLGAGAGTATVYAKGRNDDYYDRYERRSYNRRYDDRYDRSDRYERYSRSYNNSGRCRR